MVMDNIAHDYNVHLVNDHLFLKYDQKPADLIMIANEEWPSDSPHFI